MIRHLFFIIFLALFLTAAAVAQDISVEATVSANRVNMGTAIELTLTVKGTQDVEAPRLPPIDGFQTRFVGPSTRVSVVNGSYSSAKSFTYYLFPLKEGKFTIPSLDVPVGGQTYSTQPIVVDVAGSAAGNGPASGNAEPGADIKDRIKLHIQVPKTEVWVQEQVPVTIKLYVNNVPLQDITLPDIKGDGFTVGNFEQPRQYEETMNGVSYHVVEFRTSISATRPGAVSVGPSIVGASLVYKVDSGRGGLFDDDFFKSFFGSYQRRPLTIKANPFDLNVKALPEAGKPANFSGAVGQFDFQAEVAPQEVKTGDPVTLKARVFGSGNLKPIRMPSFSHSNFKSYDPQVREEGGQKLLEQVLIPTSEAVTEVPAISFSYFDPQRGSYSTLTRGPFPLKVQAPAPGEEFQVVGYATARSGAEKLGSDIVFIKDQPGELRDRKHGFVRNLPFYSVLVFFINIWGAFLGIYLYHRRLSRDPAFARRQRAPRAARAAWAQAEQAMAAGDGKRFYDYLELGLRNFFADALSIPVGDALGEPLIKELNHEGINGEIVQRLRDLEARAELARFASVASSHEEMQKSLDEARALVKDVEVRL